MMKKNFSMLTLIFILFNQDAVSANNTTYVTGGSILTSVDLDLKFHSELELPSEGDQINITYIMTPAWENIVTNDSYVVLEYLESPDGKINIKGTAFFPEGPYLKGEYYTTKADLKLDMPGFWKLKYTVATRGDIETIAEDIGYSEFGMQGQFYTEIIHVLSSVEKQAILNAERSFQLNYWLTIVSSIIGFLGVVVGVLVAYFLQERLALKIFEKENRPYLITNVKRKKLRKKPSRLDRENKAFKEKLKQFYSEKTLKKFQRYGLYIELENRGKGDALFSFLVYGLELPDKEGKLIKSDQRLICTKKYIDKYNHVRREQIIKPEEKKEYLIKEITYLPEVELNVKKIRYMNPITERSYGGITGIGGLGSLNPNITRYEFDK